MRQKKRNHQVPFVHNIIVPVSDSLSWLRARTLQIIVPEKRYNVVAPAGDGQRAKPWSWSIISRHLKGHCDVFCPFGAKNRIESFNNKARIVHLEVEENSFNKSPRWWIVIRPLAINVYSRIGHIPNVILPNNKHDIQKRYRIFWSCK